MVIAGLVFPEIPALFASEDVTVQLPTVLSVTLRVLVPLIRAVFAGNVALASLEVIAIVSFVLTTFQFASTALTETLKAVPAVCAAGVPVLPVAVPGAAVSPGASSCSFTNVPELTVIDGLVFELFEPSVTSLAVTVALPAVMNVTLKDFVPATNAALDDRTALPSEEVTPARSVIVFIRFQLASTARTVTLKGVPAFCELGVPVLPLALPGDAVSPGARSCSLANDAGLTVMEGLVFNAIAECVTLDAVTVALPAVLRVTLKLLVPFTRAAFAGKDAFASLDVIATVSLVVIRFQLASTAFTVALKAAPAV